MATTDRCALAALYNATGGSGWTNKTNWHTAADLSEWYGVKLNGQGRVVELHLPFNDLRGTSRCALRTLHAALLRYP